MTDIVAQLAATTSPDRETDLAVHLHLFPDSEIANIAKHPRGLGQEGYSWDIWQGSVCIEKRTADGRCPYSGGVPLPAYTASLDAAAALVPRGWSWRVGIDETRQHSNVALGRSHPTNENAYAEHRSPAIALCIAAIKARGAQTANKGTVE